jgi:hypothetical protein
MGLVIVVRPNLKQSETIVNEIIRGLSETLHENDEREQCGLIPFPHYSSLMATHLSKPMLSNACG